MTDLQPQETTSSTCSTEKSSRSEKLWKARADPDLLLASVMARQYGSLKVISGVFYQERAGRSRPYVTMRCEACGKVRDRLTENLVSGKIRTCRCNPRKFTSAAMVRLADRYQAIRQRCDNPNCEAYRFYGGRGIRNYFTSAEQFVAYITSELPHEDYYDLEIDRVDNNGHYEPGNLRLVTRAQNMANTRRIVLEEYLGMKMPRAHVWHILKHFHPEFPYTNSTVQRLLRDYGVAVEDLSEYRRPCSGGRKSTTSLTPDPAIVSQYLGKL